MSKKKEIIKFYPSPWVGGRLADIQVTRFELNKQIGMFEISYQRGSVVDTIQLSAAQLATTGVINLDKLKPLLTNTMINEDDKAHTSV